MNKKIRIVSLCVALIISVMCCFMLTACKGDVTNNPVDGTTPETNTSEGTENTTAAVTSVATEADVELELLSEYKPYTAYDEDGAEQSLDIVYGSAYSQYGGSLCFNDDGTFTTYIGVYADADDESGTYRFVSTTEIELTFNSGDVQIATVNKTDGETITELEFSHRGFDVVFR